MRYETTTVRIGENVGPVDWEHPIAKDMPPIWREAEKRPQDFTFSAYRRTILAICMYDGWPYWKPTPAIQFIGPLNSPEWTFFNSYQVYPDSIQPIVHAAERDPFVSPKHEGTIFYDHHCSACQDGKLPCREGRPNLCGNPIARNE